MTIRNLHTPLAFCATLGMLAWSNGCVPKDAVRMPDVMRVVVQKRWEGGEWLKGDTADLHHVSGAFQNAQAYDRCNDIRLDTATSFSAHGQTFDSIYVEARRGEWYGANTAPAPCGDQAGSTLTSRSELRTGRNMKAEGVVGFAFRHMTEANVPNECRTVILQRHSAGGASPQISLRLGDGNLRLESKNANGTYSQTAGTVTPGQWHRVVLLYKLSAAGDGYMHVYLDGALTRSYHGPTTDAPAKPESGTWKFGHYMANLYAYDVKGSGCATPPEIWRFTYNFARFTYATIEDGTHAELYREADPWRQDAEVAAYPDGSLPLGG